MGFISTTNGLQAPDCNGPRARYEVRGLAPAAEPARFQAWGGAADNGGGYAGVSAAVVCAGATVWTFARGAEAKKSGAEKGRTPLENLGVNYFPAAGE